MTPGERPVILKFGGSSLDGAAHIRAAALLTAQRARRGPALLVVSAMAGVTNALERAVEEACRGDAAWRRRLAALEASHLDALRGLTGGSPPAWAPKLLRRRIHALGAVLEALRTPEGCDPLERAGVLASGERLSVVLATAALRSAGHPALVLDGSELVAARPRKRSAGDWAKALEAAVDLPATRRRTLERLSGLAPGTIPVVTGFIAGDGSGGTVLLGRGGSDHTATILAAVLGARAVEIWTDVPGVLSAPPRWVPGARTVPRLGRQEAAALARWGGKVLHPRTLEPLAGTAIPVLVRNSFDPAGRRTVIVPEGHRPQPTALCGRSGVAVVAARGRGRPVFDPLTGRCRGELVEAAPGSGGAGLAVIVLVGAGWEPLAARALRSLRLPVLGLVPELEPGAAGLVVRSYHLPRTVKALHDAMVATPGERFRPDSIRRKLVEVAS